MDKIDFCYMLKILSPQVRNMFKDPYHTRCQGEHFVVYKVRTLHILDFELGLKKM